MWKTIIYLILLVVAIVGISLAIAYFLSRGETIRYEKCILLQNSKTGQVDCFGCYNNICKDAASGWLIYKAPEIGIPYACYGNEKGCQLAQ